MVSVLAELPDPVWGLDYLEKVDFGVQKRQVPAEIAKGTGETENKHGAGVRGDGNLRLNLRNNGDLIF